MHNTLSIFDTAGQVKAFRYNARYILEASTRNALRRDELEVRQISKFRAHNRGMRRDPNSAGLTMIKGRDGRNLTASRIRGSGTTVPFTREARLFSDLTVSGFREVFIRLFPGRGSRRFVDRVLSHKHLLQPTLDAMASAGSEAALCREFWLLIRSIITAGDLDGAQVICDVTAECIVTNVIAMPVEGGQSIDRTAGCLAVNDGTMFDALNRAVFAFEFKHHLAPLIDEELLFEDLTKVQAIEHLNHEPETRGCFILCQSGWKCLTREHQGTAGTTHTYRGSQFPAGDTFMRTYGAHAERGQELLGICLSQIIYHMITLQLESGMIAEPLASVLRGKMA